jgi:hypothetical protein
MRLEDMRIALRPRSPWEAMDLGLVIVRQWWLTTLAVWFALTLPLFLALNLLAPGTPWPALAMWWLKPLFERPLLHLYSRAVFGSSPSVKETLKASPGLIRGTGLLWHLTLGRILDPTRTYRLPVMQLEGLRGKERDARLRIISARTGGYAAGMMFTYFLLELLIAVGIAALCAVLIPLELEFGPWTLFSGDEVWSVLLANTVLWLSYALTVPASVGAGFALYLNRRTILEAWDIELNLRQMAARLEKLGAVTLVLLVLSGLIAVPWVVPSAEAAPADPPQARSDETPNKVPYQYDADAGAAAQKVLAGEAFGKTIEVQGWRLKNPEAEEESVDESSTNSPRFNALGLVLAQFAEVLAWLVTGGLVVFLLAYLARNARQFEWLSKFLKERDKPAVVPVRVGGLKIDPSTIPSDVPRAAKQLWADGESRAAVALLYRGAIVALTSRGVRLASSSTENDVLQRAEAVVEAKTHAAMQTLVLSWQRLAYAHRLPDDATFLALCESYANAFGEVRS